MLAVLLVYQGLVADRNALRVLERKRELEAQSRAFSELASKTALWDPEDIKSLEELTEIVSTTMAVRRTSVWGYYEEDSHLQCEDSFDRGTKGHTRGTILKIDDFPRLFEEFIKGEEIVINDAAGDPVTAKLHKVYLGPLGCTSLLAIPVLPGGMLAGAIWFEHEETIRAWGTEDISFARAIASLLDLRLSASGIYNDAGPSAESGLRADPAKAKSTTAKISTVPATIGITSSDVPLTPQPADEMLKGTARKTSFSERMRERGLIQSNIKADVFNDVTVLVLRFTDPFALGQDFGGDKSTTAVDHLVCHFENLFAARQINYWRILSDQIICATGFRKESNHHVDSIADLALSFQDKCSHLFADLDKPMEFKIGIDRGGVIGSRVGQRRKSYNIWGEAVSAASMLADKGVTGGIQVSQAAYRRLRKNYLFKVRGHFYLQHVGEITTYLLTGRI